MQRHRYRSLEQFAQSSDCKLRKFNLALLPAPDGPNVSPEMFCDVFLGEDFPNLGKNGIYSGRH